jgi:acyl-coenzyme A synthetase/AMP-(fatty) acid ligase/acyl carrier protein
MIEHGGLANTIQASIRAFGLTQGVRVLQHAALSFDNSIWEILMALASGGELDVDGKFGLFSGVELERRMRKQRINFAVLTPSVLSTLPAGEYPDLRALLVGGEACPAHLATQWSSGRRFWNTYGPAEASIHVTLWERRDQDLVADPPIGHPNENLAVYVLDSNLQMVPPGTPGELFIGGIGVGRGYRNRPGLTAASFLPNLFGRPGSRMYRTGDTVRYRPDGTLEYLGRRDDQIKVRGNRVEIGEIEEALHRHHGVRHAKVIAAANLIAYVVPVDSKLGSTALRAHLEGTLPSYMVPSSFVFLAELPFTPSGKLDRSRLPAPIMPQPETGREPETELERKIFDAWKQILGVEPASVHMNFFDAGGNSLLLARLELAIREQLKVEIPITDLFRYPTVRAQADEVRARMNILHRSVQPSWADDRGTRQSAAARRFRAARAGKPEH